MQRRAPVALVLLACACAPPPPSPRAPAAVAPPVVAAPPAPVASSTPKDAETPEERARRVHAAAIVVDTHDDIPSVLLATRKDIAEVEGSHTDLAKLRAGGVTGEFFSVYVESSLAEHPTETGGGALRRAIDLVDLTYANVERHPAELVLATTASEIRRAKKEGKIAILMGVEGGHAIESSLAALRVLHRLGCRYMTLTHTNTNTWADSAGGGTPAPAKHGGLSPFGEEVVREMQRLGMMVDISHVSDETFWDVVRIAKAPVIASHSSARALADAPRNLDDAMLKAVSSLGGVVMINFWSFFLSNPYRAAQAQFGKQFAKELAEVRATAHGDPKRWRESMEKLRARFGPFPRVTIGMLVDHIEHVARVAGVDHVGLGSDFDGVDALPEGLDGVDALPKITLELVRRGRSDEDITKILGGNILRVMEATEAYAASTKTRLSGDGNPARIEDTMPAPKAAPSATPAKVPPR